MKTVTGIVVILSVMLSVDGASAHHLGSQRASMTRSPAHHFI
jgi:hypothetical protein